MSSEELRSCLSRLCLSEGDAARLLSVDPRTIKRWQSKPGELPGPAEQALRAWVRLEELGLSWRPDGVALGLDKPDVLANQIIAHRRHAIELDAVLQRVKEKGGPAAPWVVDLDKRRATLGDLEITFYATKNGSFSPNTYSRSETQPDLARDRSLIDDGFASIAREIAKVGPNWATPTSSSRNKVTSRGQNTRIKRNKQ